MQPISIDSPSDKGTKDRRSRCHQLLMQIVYDFAENTTLNGLKYMAEKRTSILERLFWTSTFILSTILCVMMVYKSYVKYDTSGVVVTLKEHLVSVNEYPFPAVTICPQARIRQKRYNYTCAGLYSFTNDSGVDLKKFHSTMVLCDNDDEINSSDAYPFLDYPVDIKTFFEVAPRHEDIFMECSWRNKVDCLKKFRPTLTADGICYTFNILATDEIFRRNSVYQKRYYLNSSTLKNGWSLEKNYYSYPNDAFPRRGRANGAREDLYLSLKEVTDRDFACDRQTRPGYKVYLHHPADLPQVSLHSYAAQPGKTTSFAIKLDILDTADELLSNYAPEIRQCYSPTERYLQFFQSYSSINCQLECLTNYTIKICGCVSFYMPRNSSTPICPANKWNCTEEALDLYAAQEDLNDGDISKCRCLPSCKDVNYDADTVVTKLDLEEYDKRRKEFQRLVEEFEDFYAEDDDEDYETENKGVDNEANNTTDTESDGDEDSSNNETQTVNQIYYRYPRFVAMERSELVGLSQFLADVGGTLGLFLGFSFLTLAEIFYFFTLKFYCRYHQETPENESEKLNVAHDA
ncbi:pickpocket protein 28-like isoform X2 [Cydia pomonella]|uniref:pickpocket protein 28-like isoform X2 n=1 Tax=Cydia pomonella TaxID=82600 RepID=UPI002ADDEB49|nr:pickpocket protein 28-like isoform X2 [Cydia pomonella]